MLKVKFDIWSSNEISFKRLERMNVKNMGFVKLGKLVLLLISVILIVIFLNNSPHIDNKDNVKTQWERAFDEKLKQIIGDESSHKNVKTKSDDNKSSFKKRIYVRQRQINNIGIVVADEQPDLADIKLMVDEVQNNIERQSKNKTLQLPTTNQGIIPTIIEHDPTIDENAIGLSYKYYENSKER